MELHKFLCVRRLLFRTNREEALLVPGNLNARGPKRHLAFSPVASLAVAVGLKQEGHGFARAKGIISTKDQEFFLALTTTARQKLQTLFCSPLSGCLPGKEMKLTSGYFIV